MEPVRLVRGRGMPLERRDVDTDQIIPAKWLKRIERSGFGEGLFEAWRQDPSFVLNQEAYKGAEILLAGANFGIGSSREHAVWALVDYGFRAVVAPSFGDIFRNNSVRSGLLCAEVDQGVIDTVVEAVKADPSTELVLDVAERSLRVPRLGLESSFRLDDALRERLLSGLDDIGLTLRHEAEIARYEASRPAWLPRIQPMA
jgi:3-isopropylmalate/(R)-2-methylmalate dehydratase small subunit